MASSPVSSSSATTATVDLARALERRDGREVVGDQLVRAAAHAIASFSSTASMTSSSSGSSFSGRSPCTTTGHAGGRNDREQRDRAEPEQRDLQRLQAGLGVDRDRGVELGPAGPRLQHRGELLVGEEVRLVEVHLCDELIADLGVLLRSGEQQSTRACPRRRRWPRRCRCCPRGCARARARRRRRPRAAWARPRAAC